MLMTMTEPPSDLRPLAELARELGIPYPTLRNWQKTGKIGEWERPYGGLLASESEVRKLMQPRKREPKQGE